MRPPPAKFIGGQGQLARTEAVMNSRFLYPSSKGSLGRPRRVGHRLPLERKLKGEAPEAAPLRKRCRQSEPTVLIAEDNDDGRFMLRTLLEMKGYSVLEAQTGTEAIELALKDFPDLMLLDLQLPSINGLNVARHIRSHSPERYIPIVIISGHNRSPHGSVAKAAGCDEYLLKPIDLDELEKVLENFAPLHLKSRSATSHR